jgi:multidrug efflux pump subunit AcrA (membrane-fusion protein)
MRWLAWLACAQDEGTLPSEVPPPPPPVEEVGPALRAVGVVVPRHETVVASNVGGVLVAVERPEGSRVAAGDVIGALATPELGDQVAAATADLGAAEAALAVAAREVEHLARQQDVEAELAAAGVRSERDRVAAEIALERGVAAEREARAAVAERRARRDALRAQVTHELVAPLSGTVAEWRLEVGERSSPGVPIARVVDGERLSVRFAVAPADPVAVGQRVRATTIDGRSADGTVRSVAPEVDRPSQTVFVEAALDDGVALMPGLDCWVTPVEP